MLRQELYIFLPSVHWLRAGQSRVRNLSRAKDYFFSTVFPDRLCSFQGVKYPRRDVDHSPPSSAEVNEWNFTPVSVTCLQGLDKGQLLLLDTYRFSSHYAHHIVVTCSLDIRYRRFEGPCCVYSGQKSLFRTDSNLWTFTAITVCWTVRGSNPGGVKIFRTRPDRL